MNCCQCQGIEETFSPEYVAGELDRYRRRGPAKTTLMLIEALKQAGVSGSTLLDIGGGVGAVQHALLAAGVKTAIDVDASAAYLSVARAEAARRGLSHRIEHKHGNFVELAADVPAADIVTLDRVICCYDDMQRLVGSSSALARRLYGVVYPRDTWWIRLGLAIGNFFLRLRGSSFRAFAHPSGDIEALIAAKGLTRRFARRTFAWQVAVFDR
ncbi:MAG: class I SAM-dependent methyltransferase [Bacteroidota bacterium]